MKIRLLYLLLFAIMPLFKLSATHIVGGEMTYKCLGNNRYDVTLTIYRDCYHGVPWFDDPAAIGVFDSNNVLIDSLLIPWSHNNDTIPLQLNDPCLVAPPDICYHKSTYHGTITLPFRAGGYQLVYMRCCRNQSIVNIIDPLNTGMVCYVRLTEAALLVCNSTPAFRYWPPPLICNHQPINFDHSASDLDGDSIVYQMCTPLSGSYDPNIPMPQPPNPPPYDTVLWLSPFNRWDMMGGIPLRINSTTGMLTGTPNALGQYVVGVCALEYRNGVLLSEIRRDFQYNVGDCGRRTSSSFFNGPVICQNSRTVDFINTSISVNNHYSWDFGVTNSLLDTSSLKNPTFTYPDTGTYRVMLVSDPGSICADTIYRTIHLYYNTLNPLFQYSYVYCGDSLVVQFTNQSVDSFSNIVRNQWYFNLNSDSSALASPRMVFRQNGPIDAVLYVYAQNGCMAGYVDTLKFKLPLFQQPGTLTLCPPANYGPHQVSLNPLYDPDLGYQWSPATGLSNVNDPNPTCVTGTNTLYQVTITANNSFATCTSTHSVQVNISPPVQLNLPPDTIFCGNTENLTATVNGADSVLWYSDRNHLHQLGRTNPLPISINSNTWYYAIASNIGGCFAQDSVQAIVISSPLTALSQISRLSCRDSSVFSLTDMSTTSDPAHPPLHWYWNFGTHTDSIQNTTISFNQAGNYPYTLTIYNDLGCSAIFNDTLRVRLPSLGLSSDSFLICKGDSIRLNNTVMSGYIYNWTPSIGLSDPHILNPAISPMNSTVYHLQIIDGTNTDSCSSLTRIKVEVSPPVYLSLPPDTTLCGSVQNLIATMIGADSIFWYSDRNHLHQLGNTNPLPISINSNTWYYVIASNISGCHVQDSIMAIAVSSPLTALSQVSRLSCRDSSVFSLTDMSTTSDPAHPPLHWYWNFGTHTDSIQNTTISFNQAGNYPYTLTIYNDLGCNALLHDTLRVRLPSPGLASDSFLVCRGDTIRLHNTVVPGYVYNWTPSAGLSNSHVLNPTISPASNTVYQLQVIDGTNTDSCSSVTSVKVVVPPPVQLTLPTLPAFCGGSVSLRAISANATRFEWSLSPSFNPLIYNDTSHIFRTVAQSDTRYYVRASDQFGCKDTSSLLLQVNKPNINAPGFTLPCGGGYAHLSVVNLHTGDINIWTWQPSNGFLSGNSSDTVTTRSISATQLYNVMVENQYHCRDSATVVVNVTGSIPIANISSDRDSAYVGQPVHLQTPFNTSYQYSWLSSATLNDNHIYNPVASLSADAWIYLTVTNTDGCVNTDSLLVHTKSLICGDPFIFIPNAFSPNHDGNNDLLYVRSNVLTEVHLMIFNRWGEKVFETESQNNPWDGTFNGQELPADVYGYYMTGKCFNGEIYTKKGNVSIIR